MPLNGSVKGPGGPAPLVPDTGPSIARPSPTIGPRPGGATIRPQAAGGPPMRANSLQANAGNRPQGATLPTRRATLPSAFPSTAPSAPPSWTSTPLSAEPADAAMPEPSDPASAPPHGERPDPMKQLESLLKSQKELMDKHTELTNKATDGVGAAVSARIA